jgi:PAS domain S-box-containing protein
MQKGDHQGRWLARWTSLIRPGLPLVVVVFCIALLVGLWASLFADLKSERARVIAATMLQNANLAAAFDEHVTQTLRRADTILLRIKEDFEKNGRVNLAGHLAPEQRAGHAGGQALFNLISVANVNGVQVAASYPMSRPQNFGKSENFLYHATHTDQNLYISRPRLGVNTGKWSIYLSRPINRTDGRFNGDVVLALDVEYFSAFYRQFDLGPNGVISLIGRDGIVRARHLAGKLSAGEERGSSRLFTRYLADSPVGSYVGRGGTDGVARILSYRALSDFPLVVLVGVAEAHALRGYTLEQTSRLGWAAVSSFVIVLFALLMVAQLSKLDSVGRRLRANEEKYRALIETTDTGYLTLGGDGCVVDANMHYVRLSGHMRLEQILGRRPAAWIAGYDHERNATAIADGMRTGRIIDLQIDYRGADGRVTPVEINATVVGAGAGLQMLLLCRDISARRIAEEQHARLAAIVETSDDAILSRTMDGTITSWNAAAERIYGYSASEAIGSRLPQLVPPERRDEPDDNRRLIAAGERIVGTETVRVTKDGRRIYVSRTASPIRDTRGKIIGVSSIARDITERRRAEETQARLAAIVDNSSDAIIGRTLDGVITSWNAAAERLYGYTAAEVIGTRRLLVPPERVREAEENRQRIRKGESVPLHESVRLTADGRRIHVSRSLSPIRDSDGNVIGLSAIVRDISAQKAAEAAQALLAAIVENSSDAIIGRAVDGSVTSWNPAAERLYGYTRDEAMGRLMDELYPAEERASVGAKRKRITETGAVQTFNTVRIAKDGRRLNLSVSLSPIRNRDGETTGFSVIARDISDWLRAESEQRLAASVFASAAEGIMISDADNKIVLVNEAFSRITGFQAAELIGRNPRVLQSGQAAEDDYTRMWQSLETTGHWRGEIEDRRRDGASIWMQISVSAVRNAAGVVTHHHAIFADVTRRKLAEERLEQMNAELEQRVLERTAELTLANRKLEMANKELEAFSYSVSHDLRAPLRSIIAYSNYALESRAGAIDTVTLERLTKIVRAGERMARLIDDLLNLSRFSRQVMRRRNINLSVIAGDVVASLRQAQPGREVDVVIEPGMECNADRGLMAIVMQNLIGNAWKYSSRVTHSRIEIGRTRQDGEIIYFVRDNGAGFDMKYVGKLFGVFQRLHTEADFEGTGIGLSIVQRVISRHGGRIWADARHGEGATFYFTLDG